MGEAQAPRSKQLESLCISKPEHASYEVEGLASLIPSVRQLFQPNSIAAEELDGAPVHSMPFDIERRCWPRIGHTRSIVVNVTLNPYATEE